ncbi:hypothetical protein SNE40_006114 [Patella caerulea]|uniref:Uncharacterized protein n=1 Tax=Patella caerulea TaxID=87958 RepID=A0AAN8K0D2_PATCE
MKKLEKLTLLRQAIQELENKISTTATVSNSSAPVTNSTASVSNSTASSSRPKNLSELRKLFSPYQRSFKQAGPFGKALPVAKYTHKFRCLASQSQDFVPLKEGKISLLDAGLGEKRIVMNKTSCPQQLRDPLFEAFPKLEKGGGFELLRTSSRICLELIKPPKQGYNSEYLADSCALGQSVIYIRPVQKDLDMESLHSLEVIDNFHISP